MRKKSKPLAPFEHDDERAVAQPRRFSSASIEPGPSWPTWWEMNSPGCRDEVSVTGVETD
jgi:hypothetical protein